MAKALNKRFYKTVSVEEAEGGFVIKLDQYTLKTPAKKASDKKTLLLPSERLAELVASEWDCLLYTSPSPRDKRQSRMPSSA